MTSSCSISTLEVFTLLSSLALEELHTLLVCFYRDAEGTIPTLELYIEVFLSNKYQINHYEILDSAPLILEAELSLYFTWEGGLAERFPPRLINWRSHLQDILDSIRDLTALVHE